MEEGKAMKDYTKYDFAAIVGAEVELKRKNGLTYKGTLVFANKLSIGIKTSGTGVFRYELKENILSLTAKIKVEDMSLKQLERAFSINYDDAIIIDRTTGTLDIRDVDYEELAGCRMEKTLTDYIDCTEWGWKE